MRFPDDRDCAIRIIALSIAATCFAVAVARAVVQDPFPVPIRPALPVYSRAKTVAVRSESELLAARDGFRVIAAQKHQEPLRPPKPGGAESLKLVGTVPLPSGGLAAVESSDGSRVLRVGERWKGLELQEVTAGRAVFADSATGEYVVITIRKVGS